MNQPPLKTKKKSNISKKHVDNKKNKRPKQKPLSSSERKMDLEIKERDTQTNQKEDVKNITLVSVSNTREQANEQEDFSKVLTKDIWQVEIFHKNLPYYTRTLARVCKYFNELVKEIRKKEEEELEKQRKKFGCPRTPGQLLCDYDIVKVKNKRIAYLQDEYSCVKFIFEHSLEKNWRRLKKDFVIDGKEIRDPYNFLQHIFLDLKTVRNRILHSPEFTQLSATKQFGIEQMFERKEIYLMSRVFELGCIKLLDELKKDGVKLQIQTYVVAAATCGQLETLKWLSKTFPTSNWTEGPTSAARNGHLKILEWLVKQDLDHEGTLEKNCFASVCNSAASGGHLEILKWAVGLVPPLPFDRSTCEAAAKGGHIEILEWMELERLFIDSNLCEDAARNGHLKTLQWLRDRNPPCKWNNNVCRFAILNSDLEMLKWLRSQDPPCEWNKETKQMAQKKWPNEKWN